MEVKVAGNKAVFKNKEDVRQFLEMFSNTMFSWELFEDLEMWQIALDVDMVYYW